MALRRHNKARASVVAGDDEGAAAWARVGAEKPERAAALERIQVIR
jgi:hypothetical protein